MSTIIVLFIFSAVAFGDVSKDVIIRGKIGNSFDDHQVKVVDSMGQIYMVPRRLFPKNKRIRQGEAFYLEVHEKELKGLKRLKR